MLNRRYKTLSKMLLSIFSLVLLNVNYVAIESYNTFFKQDDNSILLTNYQDLNNQNEDLNNQNEDLDNQNEVEKQINSFCQKIEEILVEMESDVFFLKQDKIEKIKESISLEVFNFDMSGEISEKSKGYKTKEKKVLESKEYKEGVEKIDNYFNKEYNINGYKKEYQKIINQQNKDLCKESLIKLLKNIEKINTRIKKELKVKKEEDLEKKRQK